MQDGWNRYGIASAAFEALVQRLGLADASLFGVFAGTLAAMSLFGAVLEWRAVVLLFFPIGAAWRGIMREGRGRKEDEVGALDGPIGEREINESVRSLVGAYRVNEGVYIYKMRAIRFAGAMLLVIIALGVVIAFVDARRKGV